LTFKHRCLLLAALLTLVHLARFDVAQGPIVTDVRYYVYFAARMADGAVPHRDFFDNKTQLATAAGAALHATASALGLDPLRTMRVGYLGLTGLAALLLFAIHRELRELRELRDGACVAGLLGMLCYLGFSLLGFLPAIGPLPKLLMGVCASAAALLAYRGWWMLSGFVGAVAFLDWQIGVLAGLAVFVAALCEREQRFARTARVVCGGLAGLALACAYFAWNGALAVAYRQVVLTSLTRGETALAGKTFTQRLAQILGTITVACPGQAWLAVLAIAGIVLYPILLVRHRGRPTQRLVIALGIFNGGIVAFSLTDYQAYGDLFALLASLAFFAGIALNEVFFALRAVLLRLFRGRHRSPGSSRELRGDRGAAGGGGGAAHRAAAARHHATGQDRPRREVPRAAAERGAQAQRRDRRLAGCLHQLPGAALPHRAHQHLAGRLLEPRDAQLLPCVVERALAGGAGTHPRSGTPDAVVCATPRVEFDLQKSGAFERLELHADSGGYKVVLLRRIGVAPHPAGS